MLNFFRKWFQVFLLVSSFFYSDLSGELFHHPSQLVVASAKTSNPAPFDDDEIVNRILKFYQKANNENLLLGNSMWQSFFDQKHQNIHHILINGKKDQLIPVLRNPGSSDLFYGFDALSLSYRELFSTAEKQHAYALSCLDGMLRLVEALGLSRIGSKSSQKVWMADELISLLESKFEKKIPILNPYPDELGAFSSNGIISWRVPQALYQAWRIKGLLKGIEHPKVLEIGAGLGRTAFYANLLGIEDYTIVDIPFTGVSSAYFLARTLGKEKVFLSGEVSEKIDRKIKIITPIDFLNGSEKYDLIINVDSLTEMDLQNAIAYLTKIEEVTEFFLSINHENNAFTVRNLIEGNKKNILSVERYPYWMRKDYVEEIIKFNGE